MRLGRWIAGPALAALVLGLAITGQAEVWTLRLTVIALRASGFDGVRVLGPGLFAVGPRSYAVVLACTPVVLTLCGLVLLGLGHQGWRRRLVEGIALLLGGWTLLVLNTVLSIHLHRTGLSWSWSHYPGLVAVYAVTLSLCLARALRSYGEVRGGLNSSNRA
jgi:hypothetical protein